MDRLEAYVRRVVEIAELPVDGEQAEELRAHLVDSVSACQREGLTPEDAASQAIAGFGDVESVGRQLREVTPLPVSRREWGVPGALFLGALAYNFVPWGLFYPAALRFGFVLGLPILVATGLVAARLRQPLLAALAPVTESLLVRMALGLALWNRGVRQAGTPAIRWTSAAAQFAPFLLQSLLSALVLIAVCLVVARWRRTSLFTVTLDRVLAFAAHLLPFLCLLAFGMKAWVLALGALALIWLYGRLRSRFVERHVLQAAVVSLFFSAMLYGVQQYYLSAWRTGMQASFLVVSGWSIIRLALAPALLYAALAALSGHDFRYPFARLLFQVRRFRHA